MANALKSRLGKIHLLAKNSRIIRDSAFNKLVDSLQQDPEFLMVRGVVVWQVPKVLAIPAGEKSPFTGQEGQLVVIGGNQRCKAFLALGMEEVKDEWLMEAKDADGNWWSPEKAERFVLKDNNPEGLAGENDVRKMFENFSTASMQLSGIDFSAFKDFMDLKGKEGGGKADKDPQEESSDKVEKGEHGEKDPALAEFIKHREESRAMLKEIDETGFHLLLVFDSFEEKAEFISRAGLADGEAVAVNGDVYLDLVFESYDQKMEFCEKAGVVSDPPDDGSPRLVYEMFCDGRAFAKKFGIELKETGLHFRDMRVDAQLASMAREDAPQMGEKEMEEAQFAEAKREAKEAEKAGKEKKK